MINNKLNDYGLLFLRVGIGLSYIFIHGWGKIFGGPERWARLGSAVGFLGIDFLHPMWGFFAAVAEFGGGILILLGFLYRPGLMLVILTMFVASWQHIAKGDGILRAAYPMEMAVILIAMFIFGPGKYSIQYYLESRKSESKK
jgi:putative oxidoreductase